MVSIYYFSKIFRSHKFLTGSITNLSHIQMMTIKEWGGGVMLEVVLNDPFQILLIFHYDLT